MKHVTIYSTINQSTHLSKIPQLPKSDTMDSSKKTAQESLRQNPFRKLSEDSLTEILSRTSPLDASRFAVVSKGSKSAADSDNVWDRFLRMDIVSRSVSPLVYGTKKELYFRLCNSPVLLDDGKLSFSLTKKTGKKCFTVGAKDLIIAWGDSSEYWDWTSHVDSRFSEVAQLKFVCWLDIRGKIKTHMLSQRTRYGAYLIYTLANLYYGLELVNSVVRRVNFEADKYAEARASIVHLHRGTAMYRCPLPRQTGRQPERRDDGWMEIKLGEFDNDVGDDGEVEARFMEISRLHVKSGLIVEGIEFRPEMTFDS